MAELIITNGDSAADLLRAAGKEATMLPWRDVLHEGPIVAGPLETSTRERVGYLARRFRLPLEAITAEFAERDAIVRGHADFERIALWFEHDLYDQLQLVQVLAVLADEKRSEGVILVQADDFLGAQRPDTILRFEGQARPVTAADLAVGASVWNDLAAPTPEAVVARIESPDARLPFLKGALLRFLEELPAPVTGLGRTESAILSGVDAGAHAPMRLFHQTLQEEEAAFMGDMSFFRLLDDLASCDVPLIAGLAPSADGEDDAERFADADLELTMAGEDVLVGKADHVALSGVDRWWGGTRLLGRDVWRYDRSSRQLMATRSEAG
jgi:hypothetical protein